MKNALLTTETKAADARGWKMIPLNGKIAKEKGWTTADILLAHLLAHINKGGNVGLRTGQPSGVIITDLDVLKGCKLSLADFPTNTWVAETGGGGFHIYHKFTETDADLTNNNKGKLAPFADFKTTGGYVVLPGSKHPGRKPKELEAGLPECKGTPYRWMKGRSPADIPMDELAELPEWVRTKMRASPAKKKAPSRTRQTCPSAPSSGIRRGATAYGAAALAGEVEKVLAAQEGTRNDTLNTAAFKIGQVVARGDLAREEAKAALVAAGLEVGLDPHEIEKTVEGALTSGAANPRKGSTRHMDTDLGNAERFVETFGRCAKFDAASECWYIWNGQRWAEDFTGEALRMAGEVARNILIEAANAGVSGNDRGDAAKWALKSESLARQTAMLTLAKSRPGMTVPPDTFDSDPWLLNCANGTVDLRTGELRPHNPADLLTKSTGQAYLPQSPARQWRKFLARIFSTNPEVIPYLQRILGYTLTGNISEHYIWLFIGGGRNGKTTLIEAVMHAMGVYAGLADRGLLLKHVHEPHPTALADLRGMRLAVLQEVDGKPWDVARMKSLTGDPRIKARRMHCDLMEFARTHKNLAVGNELPVIADPTEAAWARIRVVPFQERIPDAEQDNKLPAKLRDEAPGILAWLVEGCLAWQKEGLTPPACVAETTTAYKHNSNPVARFLAQREHGEPEALAAADLRQKFAEWAKAEGEQPISPSAFGAFIKHCPGWSSPKRNGKQFYKFTPPTR